MAALVQIPRINANDATVVVVAILVSQGDWVEAGDDLVELETDKSSIPIEAPISGYVLRILCQEGDTLAVGTPLVFLGTTKDEEVPATIALDFSSLEPEPRVVSPTLKAQQLLNSYNLTVNDISVTPGKRLTVMDVVNHVNQKKDRIPLPSNDQNNPNEEEKHLPDGAWHPLLPHEKQIINRIAWQRLHAVPGYIEYGFESNQWRDYADAFLKKNRLMFDPLLGLIAHRLAQVVGQFPNANATLIGQRKWVYHDVNLGVTIQVGSTLRLPVICKAQKLDALTFVRQLSELQRGAIKGGSLPKESEDATLIFTSMSRWNVSRHIPILGHYNSLIVGYSLPRTGPQAGQGIFGATYDHQLLNGGEVAELLSRLVSPPKED